MQTLSLDVFYYLHKIWFLDSEHANKIKLPKDNPAPISDKVDFVCYLTL